MPTKDPFDIDLVMEWVREAVRPLPKAAMVALFEQGYTSLFEQWISCLISIRTYDEVSLPVSLRLLDRARTPEAISQLSPAEIESLIRDCTYADQKARQICKSTRSRKKSSQNSTVSFQRRLRLSWVSKALASSVLI